MQAGEDHVGVAVIVVVDEVRPPANVLHGETPQPGGKGRIVKGESAGVDEERMVFGVEGGHHEGGPAVAIDIRSHHAQAPPHVLVHAGLGADIGERSIAIVVVKRQAIR